MKTKKALHKLHRYFLMVLALGATATAPAVGQVRKRAVQATSIPGKILLYMQPGIAKDQVKALTDQVGGNLIPLNFADCYSVELPANKANDNDTAAAVAVIRADARVRWVRAMPVWQVHQTLTTAPKSEPNDPRYRTGEQYNLALINMPQAWALQKGAAGVRLGWIDSGFDPQHEDAQGQFDPGSMDIADSDSDVTADGTGPEFDHGTHTSGVAFANTNNSIGIAGICWQNIKCVALKIQKKGTANLDGAAIMNSYAYLLANHARLNVVAVNLSYGAYGLDPADTSNPEYIATKMLTDAGVLVVASAGNAGAPADGNPTATPADYPHVISVSAINKDSKLAYYSSYGKVDIAAPGGEQFAANDPGGILSLVNDPVVKYTFAQGTSDAAPHVTGVLGLLMSVPGVTPATAKRALFQGANHTTLPILPDPKYGNGILDAYASLALVSVQARITSPEGFNAQGQSSDPNNVLPPAVETFKPTIGLHLNNLTPDNVTVTIDAGIPSLAKTTTLAKLIAGVLPVGIPEVPLVQGTVTGTSPQYDVTFPVVFPTTGFFQHTVTVSGTDPNTGLTATDTRIFTITPHTIQAGLSMISIPYYEDPKFAPPPYTGTFRDVPQLLGSSATLYRYLLPAEVGAQSGAVTGAYAKYSATDPAANVNASLRPLDELPVALPPTTSIVSPLASTSDTRPLGIGYFINTPIAIPVITFGNALTDRAFKIPLHEGWNLIGDPYPFAVPFNSTEVEQAGARFPVGQAVDQKRILPYIFRLVAGDYQFDTLPNGSLQPWEGQWVYVVPKDPTNLSPSSVINLIVTPTPITTLTGRANSRATAATRPAGVGEWKLRLQAHSAEQNDSNNYIGMSSLATDGNDLTKVPKPPKLNGGISLGIVRPNSPAGLYAQDLRSLGGTKEWNIVVSTDKPNMNVTLEWPDTRAIPRSYRVTLLDTVTGRSVDVRNSSSYQFNSGSNPGARSFTIVARPTTAIAGHALISNVVVNQSRGRGADANLMDIGYTVAGDVEVAVSVLGFGGQEIARVGATRAVGSGTNHVNWNGRDAAGHPLPSGTYILRIQATTSDGQKTQYVTPLLLTGR